MMDPLNDGSAGLDHRLDDCSDLRRCRQPTGDDFLGTTGKAAELLPEHDAEGLQEPTDLVLDLAADADQEIAC
ncbi:hypothetical protein ACG873_02450 [Mesorhizobium sp. AaZ16]|uniref:hypothetical protein n=1 Tax=Mesorhizobium sp. AaZ16 TaxID=3402289 RepID=UPI00374FBA2D